MPRISCTVFSIPSQEVRREANDASTLNTKHGAHCTEVCGRDDAGARGTQPLVFALYSRDGREVFAREGRGRRRWYTRWREERGITHGLQERNWRSSGERRKSGCATRRRKRDYSIEPGWKMEKRMYVRGKGWDRRLARREISRAI